MIDVSTYATGTGALADPFIGWESCPWAAETEFYWPKGIYSSPSIPNLLYTGIAHRGEAGTVIKHTGAGPAVCFDNPGTATPYYNRWTQNVRFQNFIIHGNANTTHGLFLRGVRNGLFDHVSVRDVSEAGIWTEACVTNELRNFRCTHHEMPNDVFNVRPQYGIVFAARGADTTTTWVVTNPVIEGTSVIGILVKVGCYGNRFIGGTSEGNLGKGMVLEGHLNVVDGTDFEVNSSGIDVEIKHSYNELRNVFSTHLIDVKAGQLNKVCGQLGSVKIANNVDFCDISGAFISGTLTDQSLTTTKFAYQVGGTLMYQSRIGKVGFGPA